MTACVPSPPPGVDALTTGLSAARLDALARRYAVDRLVAVDGLLPAERSAALLAATGDVPARRVTCGRDDVSWEERRFPGDHPAHRFFRRPEPVRLVRALTGRHRILDLTCWTSSYRAGEYINAHRDGSGSIQLLVCLRAPRGAANGGALVVAGREFFLRPGEAVAFEATRLEHRTTPLIASPDEPDPRRVVLVGRYYLPELTEDDRP